MEGGQLRAGAGARPLRTRAAENKELIFLSSSSAGLSELGTASKQSLVPASGLIVFSYATGGMSADIFQLYVTQTLGYSSSLITIVALAMIASIPLQFLAPRIIDRIGHRWMMIVGAALFLPALLLMFVAGQVVPISRTGGAVCVVTGATLAEIAISISFGAAWGAWAAEFTETRTRPLYISISGFASQGTAMIAFIVQTTMFGGKVTETFYRIVLIYCVLYTIASTLVFRRLPDPCVGPRTRESGPRVGWRDIAAERDYRVILLAQAVQFQIGVPLLAVYATTVLRVPSTVVGVVLTLRVGASLLCLPIAGRLISVVGANRALVVVGSGLCAEMILWTFLPRIGTTIPAIVLFSLLVVVFQISKSAFAIATKTIELDTLLPEHRVRTFTLVDIVSSSAMQINIALGGLLVAAANSFVWVDSSFIRLDAVKITTAIGAGVVIYIVVEYRRMARADGTGVEREMESVETND
ncbi:MFS transporter [Nocardia miyunensis]|uniref:MFS transporter n=1 Tax=Nocardia miyunensis TaxID=282684 RepID=UPI0012F50604|nr:MFS transporter [Nocardia miyunensis]